MSNKNFGEPWEGKIERIRENLREGRYALRDGIFPIVKELIQNAEDARATRLLIAWDHGLPNAQHPLLRGPGLLAINNGGYDSDNARAIREMGLSSKAADSSSIGKFGLGMKSVFHLGEVFLFVAVDATGERIDADVRSPWSTEEGGLHPDWDEFGEADQDVIRTHVRSLFGTGPWFCLWVPLRTSTNCGGVDPIESYYPGDEPPDNLLGPKHFKQVAAILPLLAHLEHVQFRLIEQDRIVSHDIRVDSSSTRRASLTLVANGDGTPIDFEGQVESKDATSSLLLAYSGSEHRLSDVRLCSLEKDETKKWPKRFATNKSTGGSEQVPEKASQHAAVCFTAARHADRHAYLRIHWAVFLPLGRPETIDIGSAGWDVDLVLHGWFFPNSGRTEIEGLQQEAPSFDTIHDSATVRLAWNHRLARCGTLPLLPGVFASIARRCNWDDAATTKITTAIQQSDLFRRFQADVCQRLAWIRRLTKSGQFEWSIIHSHEPIYLLPYAPDDFLASTVFSELTSVAERQVVVFDSTPRLTSASAERPWPPESVRRLLRSVSASDLINDRKQCDYFIRFLNSATSEPAGTLFPDELVSLARSALMSVQGVSAKDSRDTIRHLLSSVPRHRCIRLFLEITDESAAELFVALCRSTASIVWVPHDLIPPEVECDGQIAASEALAILLELAEWSKRKLTTSQADRLGIVAAQVFRATRDLTSLLDVAGDMELFSGTNCREQKEVRLSWQDIVEHHRRRVLFVKPAFLATQLQEALADDSIVLISKDLAAAIFVDPADKPSQCGERHLLATLTVADKPALAPPSQRHRLFKTLLAFRDGRSDLLFRDSIRFLLHGTPDQFSSLETLCVIGDSGKSVWWRMAGFALTARNQKWRLIDPVFAPVLSEDYRREFGIEIVDAEVAGQLAASAPPESFAALRPGPEEYAALLKHLPDDNLIKRLPIHETLEGNFVSISDGCFWQGKWSLPADLQNNVRVLKRSNDDLAWKRQQQLTTPLNAHAMIAVILVEANPAAHWRLVMDCVQDSEFVSDAMRQRLQSVAWVPSADGVAVKPEAILHLPELKDEVARLVSECPGVVVDPEGLALELREHPAFKRLLAEVVPHKNQALGMLGTLLLKEPSNRIGAIKVSCKDWLHAFHREVEAPFPRIALLKTILQQFPNAAEKTFEELRLPIPAARTHAAMAFLRETFQSDHSPSRRSAILSVYGQYLRTLLMSERFAELIGDLLLPSKAGTWLSASQLCWTNDGVAPDAVVAPEIEEALADLFPDSPTANVVRVRETKQSNSGEPARIDDKTVIKHVLASADRLKKYFHEWRDVIPTEQVGGFLALLGDTPGVPEVARAFLGNRSVEATRERFGLDFNDDHRKQRLVVEILTEPTMLVDNLLGRPIKVPRHEKPSTLFVGYRREENPFPEMVITFPLYCIRLNKVDPRRFTEHELSDLLRDSAVHLLKELYGEFDPKRFDATWDDLSQSDQLDIRVTQLRIVDLGFVILDQYGLRKEPHLQNVLNAWDSAHCLKVEREAGPPLVGHRHARNPESELQKARQELKRLLEEDTVTQHSVLQAVCQRIADYYQYKTDSIPFELFQNADDAYEQLAASAPTTAPSFIVSSRHKCVVFLHFGRRINQNPIVDDLWKMSVLSLSNKGHAGDQGPIVVTGKFGLGFKSVFLACDRPKLLSGRLAFEFVGGIYPRRLMGDQRESLDEIRRSAANNDPQATIIELTLRDGIDAQQVVSRFEKLAHLLVVFGRQIRRCVWGEDGKETSWQPTEVPGVSGCQSGNITSLAPRENGNVSRRVLLFKSDAGSLCFALGSRGFESFESDIPTVWVTAPTEEELQLGFLVNGPFALDVGRAQLARDPTQNHKEAHALGQQFGKQLADFFTSFHASPPRADIRGVLRFAADVKPFDIWNSLWDRLVVAVSERVNSDQPADQLIRDILWESADCGVANFYSRYEAIPVRLPGSSFAGGLVRLADVRYAVRGALAQRERLPEFDGYTLACVRRWPSFRERIGMGKLVSHERIIKPLAKLCPGLVQNVITISLVNVLRWECPGVMIDPEKAERFGELLTRDFLKEMEDEAEASHIREILDTTEFLAADGHYHPARELLIAQLPSPAADWSPDECRRTRFAPRSRVLNDQYGEMGLRFFAACRTAMSATVIEMASWVRNARDLPTQRAALSYLVDGDAGRPVQLELKRQGLEGTWLSDLAELPSFRELTTSQQHRLADLLSRDASTALMDDLLQNASPRPSFNPTKVLESIRDWWSAEAPRALRQYQQRVYPNGGLRFLNDPTDANAHQRRKDWVTLFLIGLTHTMGRTQAEAHRGFLRTCEADGSLDMIASSERQPGPWMQWIDGFLDRQIDDSRFLQWMKQFVGIYQVSRHLDDYIELFLSVERFQHPFGLTQLTNTRASSVFQAGGVSAPPLSRVLGMGQCFVLRELVRSGSLSNRHAHPHCFVPVARVRRMLLDLGCDALASKQQPWEWSRAIHGFLRRHLGDEAANFHGAFDIPLQIVAEDVDLQMRFFDAAIESEDEESPLWFEAEMVPAAENE